MKHTPLLITSALSALLSVLGMWAADYFLTVRVSILGSFAGLDLAHNPGIAFSIALPSSIQTGVIILALILVCILAWKSAKTNLQALSFGLIIGGALGNIIDRLIDGVVTDYISVGTFPIFNVADSCITVGVVLLILEEVLKLWNARSRGQ